MRANFLPILLLAACTHEVAVEPIVVASTRDRVMIEYYHGQIIDFANSVQNTVSSENIEKVAMAACADFQKRAVLAERFCLNTDVGAKAMMCTKEHYIYACE